LSPSQIETVTPDNSLTLTVAGETLPVGEQLLALAYDGEFYLPVGTSKNKDNQLEISLGRPPEPLSRGERSLQGLIKIFFQKLISKRLKFDFAVPIHCSQRCRCNLMAMLISTIL
jgi:hypothetical protein